MIVKIKKLLSNAVIPQYSKPGDAGMDLVATSINTENEDYIEYGTGLAMEIPEGYVGLIFPRSSNSKKDLILSNSVGVIDSGYRGEIRLRYKRILNTSPYQNYLRTVVTEDGKATSFVQSNIKDYTIGDKIGQIMIIPYPKIEFQKVEELSETERGEGGFGSTGK